MGWFGKKDKADETRGKPLDFDPLNVKLGDLRPGFFADYNFITYEITGGHDYSFRDRSFRILKLESGQEQLLMMSENAADTYLVALLMADDIYPGISQLMSGFGKPPAQLSYNDSEYKLLMEADGKYRDLTQNAMDFNRCTCWQYADTQTKNKIFVILKGSNNTEAWVASTVNPAEFGNFLPRS